MDDKEFIILEFLSKQTSPIEFATLDDALTGCFDNNKDENIYKYVSALVWKGLINDGKPLQISEIGKEFFTKEKIIRDRQKEEKELQFSKLKYDVTNAERVYKTYRTTRFMAISACIVSICLLLLKLAEMLGIL